MNYNSITGLFDETELTTGKLKITNWKQNARAREYMCVCVEQVLLFHVW